MSDRSVRRFPGSFQRDPVRWAVALLAGLATGAAFPPVGAVVLLPLSVAAFSLACWRAHVRSAAVSGLCFGLAFMLVLLPWLRVIGSDVWLLVAALEALFYAGLGVCVCLVTRLPAWPLWVSGAWVASELARSSVPFGGFPWGRLGFGLVDTPLAAYSRLGGVALVTAMVVLAANIALSEVLRWAAGSRNWKSAAVAALVTMAIPLAGLLVPVAAPATAASAVVAVVQGDVPGRGLDAFSRERAVLDNHVAASRQLASKIRQGKLPAVDLVLWPENSTDIDPFADPAAAASISAAVSDLGVPTLVGAVINGPKPDSLQNIGVVWDPVTGPGARYVKRHVVPFGEYVPFRSFLTRYVQRLGQIPRDFTPGTRPGLLQLGGARIGDVICFEVAYDGLVRDVVTAGAQLLVVQTNNATYLGTGQLTQQWAISRLRAIESGKTVAVAATNGISGFAAPDGSVSQVSRPGTRALLVSRVALSGQVSAGVRYGAGVEWLLSLVGVAAAVAGLGWGRRPVALAAGGSA